MINLKKFLFLILACGSPALAAINVTEGSGKTVRTLTSGGQEVQGVFLTDGISSATINQAVQLASGTATTPFYFNPASTLNTASTNTIILQAVQLASGTATTPFNLIGTLSDNGAAAGTNRAGTLPGIYQTDYLNGTAATQGRNSALTQGTDGLVWSANLPAMRPTSYSASTNTISVAATASDIAALCGNANNTVLLYAIRASCTQTTAGNATLTIVKRSSAYAGAWSTMTTVPQDSNYAAVQSTAVFFTANPTLGTLLGHLDNYNLGCMAPATATPNDIYISPADWRMKPIVLRGATQCVGLNLEAKTVTGGAFTATFEWIETKTIVP